MFYKWFRKLNQNLRTVLVTIFIVAFLFIFLQTILGIVRTNRNNELKQVIENNNKIKNDTLNSIENTQNNNTNYSDNNNTNSFDNSNTNTTQKALINKFLELCNKADINGAYKLISLDCKEIMFPNIETFTNNYYKKVFSNKRTFEIKESKIYNEIYEVIYFNNALQNGGANNNEKQKDYFYYKLEDGQGKLSLNQFLYKQDIQKDITKDNINIQILSKQVYMDYEIYKIQVINNTKNTILINSKENSKTIYLLDNNNVKYYSNIGEISTERLKIKSNFANIFDLKFNKMYNSEREIKQIQFLDIITNYDEYIEKNQKQTIEISISLK